MATIEQTTSSTAFEAPGNPGSPVQVRERYDNFIGGEWASRRTRRRTLGGGLHDGALEGSERGGRPDRGEPRDAGGSRAFRMGRAIKAGRVWTNCYHLYPAHAAFGGYKSSGVGRENHKTMLDRYSQTKCLLVSYDKNAMGII